jgi:hypothetical protein
VYAEHPVETGPDGRKAPLLVLGASAAGRTLFSADRRLVAVALLHGRDDLRHYWIQQLRHLARSRKIGQRKVNFTADRDTYTLGEAVPARSSACSTRCWRRNSGAS